MTQIELVSGDSIVSATVSNGHLILTKQSGAQVDCGQVVGIQGIQGLTGATGATGATGTAGTNGTTPAFTIGTVTTGPSGSTASATVTGTTANPILNLTIPTGPAGANGSNGNNSSPIVDAAAGIKGVLALSGDLSGTAATPLLKAITTAGTVGSSTKVPVFSYDSAGRVTSASQVNLALGINRVTSYASIPDPTTVLAYQLLISDDGIALYSTGTAWRLAQLTNNLAFSTLGARDWLTSHGLVYGGMTCFVGQTGLYYMCPSGSSWLLWGCVGSIKSSAVSMQGDVGEDSGPGLNSFSISNGVATWNYSYYSGTQRYNNNAWGQINAPFYPANDGTLVHGVAEYYDSGYGLSGLAVRTDGLIIQGIKYVGGNGGGGVNAIRGTLSWRIAG